MPSEDALLVIVVLIFMVALVVVALIGYFKFWRSVPEDEVVISLEPVEYD